MFSFTQWTLGGGLEDEICNSCNHYILYICDTASQCKTEIFGYVVREGSKCNV